MDEIKQQEKRVETALYNYNGIVSTLKINKNTKVEEIWDIKDIINDDLEKFLKIYYDELTLLYEMIVEKIRKGEKL